MHGRITAEGNARKSKVGQTVFNSGKESDLAARIIRLCEGRFGLTRRRNTKAACDCAAQHKLKHKLSQNKKRVGKG
jgi:hypothetical protein